MSLVNPISMEMKNSEPRINKIRRVMLTFQMHTHIEINSLILLKFRMDIHLQNYLLSLNNIDKPNLTTINNAV